MLLRGAPIRIPRNVRAIWITALTAVLGAVTGWYLCGRRWLRILGLAALGALCLGLSLAAAWYSRTLYNPLIAILALIIASELCVGARALHRYR
jgi:CHASE2 domain-containing sensor protein